MLKDGIKDYWNNKLITIHTIGFTNNHDFTLLDNMRKTGTHEGIYRFADPSENLDSLSAKINSVIDNLLLNSNNSKMSVILNNEQFNILNKNIRYEENSAIIDIDFINDKDYNKSINYADIYFTMNSNQLNEIHVSTKIGQVENKLFVKQNYEDTEITKAIRNKMWNNWLNISIDNIAEELLNLPNSYNTSLNENENKLLKELNLAIIYEKIKTLALKISDLSAIERLTKLQDTVKQIMKGELVDTKKIVDMKYEGRYKTNYNSAPQLSNTTTKSIQYNTNQHPIPTDSGENYVIYQMCRDKKYQGGTSHSILRKTRYDLVNYSEIDSDLDNDGNTVIQYMAKIGYYKAIQNILNNCSHININHINNKGELHWI